MYISLLAHISVFHFPETQLIYTVSKGRLQSIIRWTVTYRCAEGTVTYL